MCRLKEELKLRKGHSWDIARTITRRRHHQGIDPIFVLNHLVSIHVSCILRRTNKEVEEQILSATLVSSEDDVEIMVDIESDDEPMMAINLDEEELVVQSVVAPKAEIVVEEEETLEETLAAKVESGEGNSRLQRRMKRKQQRELVEITEKMINNIPMPVQPQEPSSAVLPVPELPNLPPPADARQVCHCQIFQFLKTSRL